MIDTTFDFRTDTPPGKDPDSHSPTLQRYHQLLWSRPLPSGELFELEAPTRRPYRLLHHSALGRFELSSDAVMASYNHHLRMASVLAHFSEEERAHFDTQGYTMGGMIIWPANKVDNKMTINGARGFLARIADRMDLTLECIRRHYEDGGWSPLDATLARYADFFDLFGSFDGFVFLLQDLLTADRAEVRFFMPFDDFQPPSRPRDVEMYREFRRLSLEFLAARNRRISSSGR